MKPDGSRAVEHPSELNQGSFEEQWPPLAARLGKRMARSCPDLCEREDLVQEVGLRLFRMWDRLDGRPLWPLVLTIALNLRRDAHRAWHEPTMPLTHDLPADFDVERESMARVELRRVQEALQMLSAAHRDVLLAEIGKLPPTHLSPAAMKMTRMRARRRLNQLLEGSSGIFVTFSSRFRDRFISFRNAAVSKAYSLSNDVDLSPYAAGVMAAAITLAVPGAAGVTPEIGPLDEVQVATTGWSDVDRATAFDNMRAASDPSTEAATQQAPETGQQADAQDDHSGYDVDLPSGGANVEAEGILAGSRLGVGPAAPFACIGSPGAGSCGSGGAPVIKARVRVRYGEYTIEKEISIDPGADLE